MRWYKNSHDEHTAHAGMFTLRVFPDGAWRVEGAIDVWGDPGDTPKQDAEDYLKQLLELALAHVQK
jgi:hypothetical protein